jgi:hypothetical protein
MKIIHVNWPAWSASSPWERSHLGARCYVDYVSHCAFVASLKRRRARIRKGRNAFAGRGCVVQAAGKGEAMIRYRVKCSECGCKAFSDPMPEGRPGGVRPARAGAVADLSDAIAHLATCSHFAPPRVGQWKYCAPDSRPE